MKYVEKVIPDAFHGTCEKYCNSIHQQGFELNRSDKLRLGDGVYFYEASYEDAEYWATHHKACKEIGIFRAVIVVHEDDILDLHNKDDRFLIKDIAKELTNKYKSAGKNSDEITDGLVINYICKKYEDVFMVRGTFTDIKRVQKIHPNSYFSEYSQLVISVRNTDIIKEYSQVFP